MALKATSTHQLTAANRRTNRRLAPIRSRVEFLFRVMKRQFGYPKTRYGLLKNAAQVFALIGLTNPYLARRTLMS